MIKLFKFAVKLLILGVAVIVLKSGFDTAVDAIYPLRYEESITASAEENSIDKYLVMGLIRAESNYIYDAHSGVARGLMQITDDTAKWIADKMGLEFEENDIENPDTNIKMGCYYLAYLIQRYENVDVALAAYNGGPGNVDKWLGDKNCSADGKSLDNIPFAETREYVERVNKYAKIYKWRYGKEDKQ